MEKELLAKYPIPKGNTSGAKWRHRPSHWRLMHILFECNTVSQGNFFFSTSRSLPNAHKPPLQPQHQPNSSVCILGRSSGRHGVTDWNLLFGVRVLTQKGSSELGLFTDKLPRELLWQYRWKTFGKSVVAAIFWVEMVHWKSPALTQYRNSLYTSSPPYCLCFWWRDEHSTLVHCDWEKATGSVSLAKKGEDKVYPKLQIFLCTDHYSASYKNVELKTTMI